MLTYKGFDIDSSNQIFRNRIRKFTARWFTFENIEAAKNLIDQSEAMKIEQDKPKPRKVVNGPCELESGAQAAEDFERWVNNEAEMQMEDNI